MRCHVYKVSDPDGAEVEALGHHRDFCRGLRTYRAAQFRRAVVRLSPGENSHAAQRGRRAMLASKSAIRPGYRRACGGREGHETPHGDPCRATPARCVIFPQHTAFTVRGPQRWHRGMRAGDAREGPAAGAPAGARGGDMATGATAALRWHGQRIEMPARRAISVRCVGGCAVITLEVVSLLHHNNYSRRHGMQHKPNRRHRANGRRPRRTSGSRSRGAFRQRRL